MTDIKVTKTPIRGKALCILPDETLLCYRGGIFTRYDTHTYATLNRFILPNRRFGNTLGKIRLLERLLHSEARWALPICGNHALIATGAGLFNVDCATGNYTAEQVPVKGKPLMATHLQGIQGFEDSVVVGDYTLNPERQPVSLYQRNENGEWRCAYTFPAGTVRHIHGVFADTDAQRVYILTGDEDTESGTWLAEDNFRTVTPLLVGSQQYRACQMLASSGQLLYMTDAPSEQNAIYRYLNGEIKRIAELSGTCIYGASAGNIGVLSTTCEPDAHASNRLSYWLTNRPGKGIVGRNVDVFYLNADGEMRTVAQFEHDGLPLRLFQYGTVTFSNVRNGVAFFSAHCVKKDEERVFRLTLQ